MKRQVQKALHAGLCVLLLTIAAGCDITEVPGMVSSDGTVTDFKVLAAAAGKGHLMVELSAGTFEDLASADSDVFEPATEYPEASQHRTGS
ncbi:MAG: hypothetical protein JXQ75_22305 [Phycisphaerae bacterium]|nr:hypothetical protein [Phycisphaerae bacterium]